MDWLLAILDERPTLISDFLFVISSNNGVPHLPQHPQFSIRHESQSDDSKRRGFAPPALPGSGFEGGSWITSHRKNDSELGLAAEHARIRLAGSLERIGLDHGTHSG